LASTTVRQSTELCKAASVGGLVRRQHGHHDTSDHHHRRAGSFRWRLVRLGTLVLGRSKSVKEVAEIIGIAEATVKTRMFYADFYRYAPPRPLKAIEADIRGIEHDILRMLADITGTKPEEIVK
jgi:DNA-binding CsgD family transcriptional regulator